MRISLILGILLFTFQSFALNPVNPKTLCERFISSKDKTACEKTVKAELDWYVAGICEQQEDSKPFFDCLEEAKFPDLALNQLEACSEEKMSDEDRLACVKKVREVSVATNKKTGSRVPAADKNKNNR